jgi:hypothetical protein
MSVFFGKGGVEHPRIPTADGGVEEGSTGKVSGGVSGGVGAAQDERDLRAERPHNWKRQGEVRAQEGRGEGELCALCMSSVRNDLRRRCKSMFIKRGLG